MISRYYMYPYKNEYMLLDVCYESQNTSKTNLTFFPKSFCDLPQIFVLN